MTHQSCERLHAEAVKLASEANRLMADDREDEAFAVRERLITMVGQERADRLMGLA